MRTLRMMALAAPMLATLACRDLTTAPPQATAVAKVGVRAAVPEPPFLLQIIVSDPSHVTIRSTGANSGVDYDGSNPDPYPPLVAYDGVVLSTFFTSPIRQFVGLYVNSPVQYEPGPTDGNLGVPTVNGESFPLNELYSTDFFNPPYGHGGRDLGIFNNSADGRHTPLRFSTESPAFMAAGQPGPVEAWFNSTVVEAGGSLPSVGSTGDILAGWAEGQGPVIGRWVVVSEQSITFTSTVPSLPLANGTYAVTATATSGLPVSFTSLTPATCTLAGNVATFVATGTCTISANQEGNTFYLPAAQQTQSMTVLSPRQVKERVLAQINAAIPGAEKKDRDKLAQAASRLASSLNPALWIDDSHLDPKRGEQVFEDEKEATQKLAELRDDKKSSIADATLAYWIRLLVADDRQLAQTAITDAAAGDQKSLAEAAKRLAMGDAESGAGKVNSAIEHYKNAWQKAQEALKR